MSPVDVERLRKIAEIEFSDIVKEASIPDMNELHMEGKQIAGGEYRIFSTTDGGLA